MLSVSFLQLHTKVISIHSKNYRKNGRGLQANTIVKKSVFSTKYYKMAVFSTAILYNIYNYAFIK